ncbi:MAG: hypothetical protein PHT51_00215 [Patescibacteria group bacterium]|nr:hypothetical protein [Patescibacteria group bacterium]MDD4610658.1 hypothetical protein [Patescibacteria group bacterium]
MVALYRLADELGIIKRSKQKNSFLFLVEDVSALLQYISRQEQKISENKSALERLLPQLRTMMSFDVDKPKIFYYEGKEGLKRAFETILDEADEIIGYGSDEDDEKFLPELYPKYYERRVKNKIPVKAIIPATPFNIKIAKEKSTERLRNTHLISPELNFPIQINIYRHTVIFFSYEENFALVIKSKPMAKCLKMIFNLAFDHTAKFDQNFRK